jgi:hypothetical protein
MSGYALLRPLLAAAAAGREIGTTPPEAPARGPAGHEAGAQAHEELTRAHAALIAINAGARADALAALLPLLDAPLRPSPFETALEEVGARVAADLGDAALLQAFLERRRAYARRFAGGAALIGMGMLLERPASFDSLASTADEDAHEVHQPAPSLPLPAPSGFVPFAAEADPDTRAYVVTLRHLQDARTASFAVHRVAWHDLESDDVAVSDLVLAFENDAGAMLRAIDPETLRLRLFFGDGPAYDEAATAEGTLFDVEVNPPEGRIYLKLRRPAAWGATGLPVAELWRNLRSCVLITEPG